MIQTLEVLSDDQATNVLRALDALDELEAAALKLVRAELACGPVVDGLIADPLTEGSRLDLLCLADTLATDLLSVMGRRETVARLLEQAPGSSARDALTRHLSRGTV
jgi:hypothetical protein